MHARERGLVFMKSEFIGGGKKETTILIMKFLADNEMCKGEEKEKSVPTWKHEVEIFG